MPNIFKGFAPHGLLPQPLRALIPQTAAVAPPPPQLTHDTQPTPDRAESSETTFPPLPAYIPSAVNGFGLFRSYLTLPTRDPEADLCLDDFCDAPTFSVPQALPQPWWTSFGRASLKQASDKFFAPFLNVTTFRLMAWFYSGSSMKSLGELDRLVNNVLCAEDFCADELCGFSASREAQSSCR